MIEYASEAYYSDDAGNRLATCAKCEREINVKALAHHPYTPRMEALCESLHSLRGARGTQPWNPGFLAEWYGVASGGERACIAFVLYVWNSNPREWESWGIPPFGIADFERLDDDNRDGIVAWFAKPFWP